MRIQMYTHLYIDKMAFDAEKNLGAAALKTDRSPLYMFVMRLCGQVAVRAETRHSVRKTLRRYHLAQLCI